MLRSGLKRAPLWSSGASTILTPLLAFHSHESPQVPIGPVILHPFSVQGISSSPTFFVLGVFLDKLYIFVRYTKDKFTNYKCTS